MIDLMWLSLTVDVKLQNARGGAYYIHVICIFLQGIVHVIDDDTTFDPRQPISHMEKTVARAIP